MDECVRACQDLGEWAKLVGLVVLGSRLIWAEIVRRRLKTEKKGLAEENEGLKQEVRQLSMPPARIAGPTLGDLTLHLTGLPVETPRPPATPSTPDKEEPDAS